MLAVRENRYIVLAKDFEKAYKTVIKKDEQEHEFYKQNTPRLDISISFYPVCFSLYLYVQCNIEDIKLEPCFKSSGVYTACTGTLISQDCFRFTLYKIWMEKQTCTSGEHFMYSV